MLAILLGLKLNSVLIVGLGGWCPAIPGNEVFVAWHLIHSLRDNRGNIAQEAVEILLR
jgi:hypothetical protein